MPYPAGHREELKQKIIASARRLFNRGGFEGVSITEIMRGADLTHGGFYSYFHSKGDLYAEVMNCFLPIRTGKAAGKEFAWTFRRRTLRTSGERLPVAATFRRCRKFLPDGGLADRCGSERRASKESV